MRERSRRAHRQVERSARAQPDVGERVEEQDDGGVAPRMLVVHRELLGQAEEYVDPSGADAAGELDARAYLLALERALPVQRQRPCDGGVAPTGGAEGGSERERCRECDELDPPSGDANYQPDRGQA